MHFLSHEIGHSIDPCELFIDKGKEAYKYAPSRSQQEAEGQFPFGNLTCLRGEKSAHARRQEPLNLNAPDFCGMDQIREGFAEWMAAEVTPLYINKFHSELTFAQRTVGYENVFRVSCNSPEIEAQNQRDILSGKFLIHPDFKHRINGIFMTNPEFRAQMKCSTPSKEWSYCPASGPAESGNTRKVIPIGK